MADDAAQERPRNFFQRIWDGIIAFGAKLGLWNAPAQPPPEDAVPAAYVPENDNSATLSHLPRSLDELTSLPVQEKLLLSAVTASGCDAVAYYTPDGKGQFALAEHIDLYPERNTTFTDSVPAFVPGTFATEQDVASNPAYHIPVYVTDEAGQATGTLRGVIVLHAPAEGFSRVQTAEEQARKEDMHEPDYVRKAKLEMAAHIVEHHQDMLGGKTQAELIRRGRAEILHHTVDEKIDYFTQLAKDMFATFTRTDHHRPEEYDAVKNAGNVKELTQALRTITRQYDSRQALHVLSVTDLTRLSVDALNKDQPEPVINPRQAELVELLALLHDVGKTQMSSQFFKPWESKDPEEKKQIEEYGTVRNHNHPLFTLVTMLLYQQDGLTAGSHHHGLFRYSTEELEQTFGPGSFSKQSILLDNVPPSELPPISKVMRVADVSGAMTDSGKPLDKAIMELAVQAGYDPATKTVHPVDIAPGTIDPDCLCFMIDKGLFKTFGEQREREEREAGTKGWVNDKGEQKYDAAAVDAAGKTVLAAFGWEQKREEVSSRLRQDISNDKLLRENPAPGPVQKRAAECAR